MRDILETLRSHGVQVTPQRLAVAEFVLGTDSHPSADEVWEKVRQSCPSLSRATVYNTLNMLVEKGLVRTQTIREGATVFDAHVGRHHHLIDESTGAIYDIPWEAIAVSGPEALGEFEVTEYSVVMRGRRRLT